MTQFEQKDLTLLHDFLTLPHDFLTSAHDLMRFLKKTFSVRQPVDSQIWYKPPSFSIPVFSIVSSNQLASNGI